MRKSKYKILSSLLVGSMIVGSFSPARVSAAEVTNVAKGKSAVVGFAEQVSDMAPENSMSPASLAVDGKHDDYRYYASWNDDYERIAEETRPSVYFEVDLKKSYDLSSVKMWRYWEDGRSYQNTMIVASEDETFDENDQVIYSTVTEEKYAYGLNADLSNPDETYAETSEGKEFSVDDGVSGRYIRVYMRGSMKTNDEYHAGNHLIELEVYGSADSGVVDPEPEQSKTAFKNAEVYQSFPTHYQDKASNYQNGTQLHIAGQVTHPDIVKVEDGWNGYKYWMVYTPNVSVTSQYENPYIAASNDGQTWIEPEGIENPIEPEPISTRFHNCDADMVYNEEMDAMMAYWNWADDNGNQGAEVRMRVSYDGIHWGVPVTYDEETGIWTKPENASQRVLKEATVDQDGIDNSFITVIASKDRYDMLSPTFTYDETRDIFVMWANNTGDVGYNNGQNNFVETRWSKDGINWSKPERVQNFLATTTEGEKLAPWHQDISYIPELKEYWAFSQCFTGGNPDGSMLYLTTSKDGIHWEQVGTEPILSPGEGEAWDSFQIYRSTFLYEDGVVKLWYSALQDGTTNKKVMDSEGQLTITAGPHDNRVWRIGYTESNYLDIMKVQTGDENFTKPAIVKGDALVLESPSKEMEIGDSLQLTVGFEPENTSDQIVIYSSSDASVAEVSPFGIVSALKAGTATIKAETKDGISAEIEMKVNEPEQQTGSDVLVYLSDMEWESDSCGETKLDTSINDRYELKLLVNGREKTFAKGLGTQADSEIVYDIEGKGVKKFQAYAGVNRAKLNDYNADPQKNAIVEAFEIEVDGELLATSGEMNPSMDAYKFDVEIPENAKKLTLRVKSGEVTYFDWSDWADAKFTISEENMENLALGKEVTVKKSADDSEENVNGERPQEMVTDGIINSDNYCDFGMDDERRSAYLQVDLGADNLISKINMWRYWKDGRTYDATVIAVSDNKDFTNPAVVYNSDSGNVHGFGVGQDELYAETENGKEFKLSSPIKARYVRVYTYGVKDGGTTNHVVELQVLGVNLNSDDEESVEPGPEKRIKINNENPLLIMPLYGKSYDANTDTAVLDWGDTLVGRWNAVPDDLKNNAVIELHLGGKIGLNEEDGHTAAAFYENQLKVAEENNIPIVMVVATAGQQPWYTGVANLSTEWIDSMFKEYTCLKGIMSTENYWTDYNKVANMGEEYLKIAHENGGYFIWSEHQEGVIENVIANSKFNKALQKYSDSFIFTWKNTPAGTNSNAGSASYMQGLWLTGVVEQWGGLADTWKWYEKRFGKLFGGNQSYMAGGEEARPVATEPEALLGIEMMSIYTNGGCVYNFEHPAYVYGSYNQVSPAYENVIAEFMRYAIENPAPSKEEVIADTEVAFYGKLSALKDSGNMLQQGINWDDATLPTQSTGRYGLIPAVPEAVDASVVEETFEGKTIISQNSPEVSSDQKVDFFENEYDELYQGDGFAQLVNDIWYLYNSNVNVDEDQNVKIQVDESTSMDVTMTPHTYAIVEDTTEGISVYLNNYRVDKDSIWENYGSAPNDERWDTDHNTYLQDWIRDTYIPNPDDDEFRTTTFVVSDVEEAPTVEVVRGLEDQYNEPVVEFNPDQKTATVTVESNGYVDFVICTEEDPQPAADKTELSDLISQVEEMDLSKYTEASAEAVRKSLEAAKAVLNDEEATQEEVDAAVKDLQTSVEQLEETEPEPSVNKEGLKNLISQVEKMDLSKYTEVSAEAVRKSLEAAKAVLNNEQATQEEVDAAISALQDSIDKLENLPENPESDKDEDKGNTNTNTNNSEDTSQGNSQNDENKDQTKAVRTGDLTDFTVWIVLMLCSSMGVLVIRKKRNRY